MPARPSKRRRTAAAGCAAPPPPASAPAAALQHTKSATSDSEQGGVADAAADPSLNLPSDQQPGELQAACAAELACAAAGWPASLAPDRAAAIRRLALSTFLQDRLAPANLARGRLTDLIGVAGGFVDGGLAGRAIVTHRRLLGLPFVERMRAITALPPELQAAVEALLDVPGWAGPAWMDTTDRFGGFKKLQYFPNVALAVSKTGKLEVGKVYGAPVGWHWGSRAEVAAIMGGGEEEREPLKTYHYNKGGWEAYAYYSAAWLAENLPNECFAGIVCVAD